MEAILVSYGDLDRVKANLKAYEASSDKKIEVLDGIREDLTNIINVFNGNIELSRNERASKETFQFKVTSDTKVTAQNSIDPTVLVQNPLAGLEAGEFEELLHATQKDRALTFEQLGAPQQRLKEKTEKLIDRATKQSLPKEQFPTLLQPEIVEKYKIQTLGQYEPEAVSIPTTTTSWTTSTPFVQENQPYETPAELLTSTAFFTSTITTPTATTTTETTQLVEPGTFSEE